ncbi:DUF2061 domain-containing protein [Planctomycetota bacterium]
MKSVLCPNRKTQAGIPDNDRSREPMMKDNTLHFKETNIRSILKGIGWRALASLTTMLLVLIFTRKLTVVLEVGALEIIAKLMLYYGYERVWNRIDWGRMPISSGEPEVLSER